jgi:hypothetical protein
MRRGQLWIRLRPMTPGWLKMGIANHRTRSKSYLRLQEACVQCSRSQHSKYLAHLEDIAKRTAEGDTTAHQADGWSRDDWDQDARERLGAFKAELKKIAESAWQIAEPELLAKSEALDLMADGLDEIERARYASFCVPYRAPAYIAILRKYALSLRDGQRKNVGLPSSMLENL